MARIKRQNLIPSTHVRGYNTQFLLYPQPVAVLGFTFWGASVMALQLGGTNLYCHGEPPLTSGKLCFYHKLHCGAQGSTILLGGPRPPALPFERPLSAAPHHHHVRVADEGRSVILVQQKLTTFLGFGS